MNKFLLGAAIGLGAAYLFKTMNLGAQAYSYPGYDMSWIQAAQNYRPGRQSLTPPVLTHGGSHAAMCEASIDNQIARYTGLPLPAEWKSKIIAQLQIQKGRCTPGAWTPHGTRVSGA